MPDFSLPDDVDVSVPPRRTETGDGERAVRMAIRERRRIARRMQAVSAQLRLSARPPRAAGAADHALTDDRP